MKFKSLNLQDSKRHGDIPQFKKANLKVAITNIFPFKNFNSSWVPLTSEEFYQKLKRFKNWLKKYKVFKLIRNKKDLFSVVGSKQIGLILGTEGLNFISHPNEIFRLYEEDIRVFGLNWNIDSKFSSSLKTNLKSGLSEAGKVLIKILEKIPVVIDLAHSSLATIKDVFRLYKKPIIFSHNGFKGFVNFEQNLDYSIFQEVKKRKGLVGLTLLPYSINFKGKVSFENWYHQLKRLNRNFKDNLAIGTDFFGFPFTSSVEGAINYIDFSKNLKKYKVNNKITFQNAFKLFAQSL
jgi:microsomal dipeptidase-like Zn-dependent dipeptidase